VKICVIGAGDGGAIAANEIRRLNSDVQIDVFSQRVGLGCPPCPMPMVIGGAIATWEGLIHGFRQSSFWEKRNINVHLNTKVTGIVRQEKYIIAGGERYNYDKLILALGATPTIPPFPGLDGKNEYSLSTDMADGVALWNVVDKYNEAAIIGGGFIGLEIAQALKARGYSKICLLVRRGVLRAYLDEDVAEKLVDVIEQNGVELLLSAKIEGVDSSGKRK